MLLAVIEALRTRLAMESLPEELRGALAASLERLLAGGNQESDSAPRSKGSSGAVQLDRRTVVGGQILFEEGEDGHEAYLISDGKIDIYRVRDGREEVIATLGRGEIVGEMSLIDNRPRAASARARAGTSLVVISRGDLKKRMARLESSDRLLKLLVDTLVRRLRSH